MTRRISSTSVCSTVPYTATAAAFTQVSIRPNRIAARSANSVT
jgi:hypothetical protein